jgi:hypothetical protein
VGRSALANEGATREIAYYYPNPIWDQGDWVKNLILFFDGVALLVPDYLMYRKNKNLLRGHSWTDRSLTDCDVAELSSAV